MNSSNEKNNHEWTLIGFWPASRIIGVSIITAIVAERTINWSNHGGLGFTGGLIISILIVAVWGFTFYKPIKRIIGKAHFAVTILLFLAGGTALGTFIRQHGAPSYYEDTFGNFLGKFIQITQLADVFHSWWYVGLFLLLTVSLITVSLTRKFSKENIGFHLAHLSLILIFLGVWADFFFGMRGIMQMQVGQKNNIVLVFQQNTNYLAGQINLEFNLKLDKFESGKFEPDYRIQLWKIQDGNVPRIITTVAVNTNEEYKIHSTDISFKVLEYFPDHYWDYEVGVPKKKSDKAVNPLALVEVIQPEKVPVQKYLYPPKGNMEALLMIEESSYFLALVSTKEHETKYWKSHLKVLDASGNTLKEGVVQVNQPLQYAGYRFYQTDFDPNRPNYSGIGVSREPGLYMIYLGFYLLVIGVFIMFYVQKEQRTIIPINGNGDVIRDERQAILNGNATKVKVNPAKILETKKVKP